MDNDSRNEHSLLLSTKDDNELQSVNKLLSSAGIDCQVMKTENGISEIYVSENDLEKALELLDTNKSGTNLSSSTKRLISWVLIAFIIFFMMPLNAAIAAVIFIGCFYYIVNKQLKNRAK